MEPTLFPLFSMVNDFESKSFHIPEIKAQHRSLYYFLLGVLMHRKGANRFNMALDYGMNGAKIGNHRTYITTLQELQEHGFLTYTAGKNRFSFPIIELHFCKPTASLLQVYCKSIGVSTASNIKAKDAKDTKDAKDDKPAPPSDPKGAHLFKDSPFKNLELFKQQFTADKFKDVDLDYYYDSMLDWSEAKGAKKLDWIATARGFIRRDEAENKVKKKASNNSHNFGDNPRNLSMAGMI